MISYIYARGAAVYFKKFTTHTTLGVQWPIRVHYTC